jgi:hypothetical protein
MNTVTSSRLNILKNCNAMLVLPWTEGSSGRDAQRGTRVHEGIVKRVNKEPTMLDFDEERMVSAAVTWLLARNYKEIRQEVAYSLSLDGTVRRILNTEHRDYGPLTTGEVPGTLDVVTVDQDGLHEVIDWKTGNEVEEPGTNWQLLFGASCLARLYSLDEVKVTIAYVRGDHVYAVSEKVGRLTLDKFRASLNARMDVTGAPLGAMAPQPGQHCRYCPAAPRCPKQQQAILAVDPGAAELGASPTFAWTTELLSPENDALMVERAIKQGGIPLANGKVWKQKIRVMPRFLRARAEEMLGPERAAECIEKKEELYFTQVKP